SPMKKSAAGVAAIGTRSAAPIRAGSLSVEAGFHRASAPRFALGDERQGTRRVKLARRGAACHRFLFPVGPRRDRFASHRTTFLTGSNTDHRVMPPPNECFM